MARTQYQIFAKPPLQPNPSLLIMGWFQPLAEPAIYKDKFSPRNKVVLSVPAEVFINTFPSIIDIKVGNIDFSSVTFQKQFQYQANAYNPFTPTAPALSEFAWYSDFSRPPDVATEAVNSVVEFVAVAPAVVPGEDSWHQPWSLPTKFGGLKLYLQQSMPSFVNTFPSNDTVPFINREFSRVPLRKVFQYQQTAFDPFIVPAPTVTMDEWFKPFADPTRRGGLKTHLQQAYAPFINTFPSQTNIVAIPSAPPNVIFRRQLQYQANAYTPFLPNIQTDLKWFQQWSTPTKLGGLETALQQFLALTFFQDNEPTSLDKWFNPLSEPVRLKGLLAYNQPSFFTDILPIPSTSIAFADVIVATWSPIVNAETWNLDIDVGAAMEACEPQVIDLGTGQIDQSVMVTIWTKEDED